MRISIRQRIGRVKFSLVVGTITQVQGINSTLKEDGHIVMWEFDETDLFLVRVWLRESQWRHHLPPIYVSQSHPGGGYHAYCMVRLPWLKTVEIVAGTEGVDSGYVSMCAMRGHWTLRLTDKGQGAPEWVETLDSPYAEAVSPRNLESWVNYEVWSAKRLLTLGKRGL